MSPGGGEPAAPAPVSAVVAPESALPPPRRWWTNLAVQVLLATIAGVALGVFAPAWGRQMRPLGELFIRLIRMIIGPVVFFALASGIGHMGSLRKVGRIGLKALIYFEVLTTIALVIGFAAVLWMQPGIGVRPPTGTAALPAAAAAAKGGFATKGGDAGFGAALVSDLVPDNVLGSFVGGNILQVVVLALLFGAALILLGPRAAGVARGVDALMEVCFAVIRIVMYTAPIGAFGAMAFTVGKFGLTAFLALGELVACTYAAAAVFVLIVLAAVAHLAGFNLYRFLRYLAAEILIVIGTSSSESVLPQLMQKLEQFGVARPVVGLVLPTGYTFNLDGLALSLPISVVFIAEVYRIHLGLEQELAMVGLMLLTSKGAAGVTGAAFAALAATVAATGFLPMEGLALVVGVEAFLSLGRAVTNVIGNAVATVVVARWEGQFDRAAALAEYRRAFAAEAVKL